MNVSFDRYVHQGYWGVIPTKNYVYLKATFYRIFLSKWGGLLLRKTAKVL